MARHWTAALAALLFSGACLAKETLYATSLRSQIDGNSVIAGNLYKVDPSTASARLVGSIHVGDTPIGVIAIAEHPRTGVVYGISAGITRTRSILSIDLDRATATVVSALPVRATDIGFDHQGGLYMWASDLHRLVKVDLDTGNVTPMGPTLEGSSGGAIAITPDGREAIVAVNGATGRLYRIDLATGFLTPGPELSNAPFDASIDNLTFSPTGELYAVNSDGGSPSKAALVTVDAQIGFVSRIGLLPDDVRGLIFAAERPSAVSIDTLRVGILAALALAAAVLIVYAMRRT